MTDFEALQQLCNTADQLSNRYTSASSPDFKAWKTKADSRQAFDKAIRRRQLRIQEL